MPDGHRHGVGFSFLDIRKQFPHLFRMRTVEQIIEDAGGRQAVSARLNLKDVVRKWPSMGIPYRYWPELMEMAPGLTADELLQANIAVKDQPAAAPSEAA